MSLFYGYHDDDNNNEEYLTKKGGEITGELVLNKAIIKNNPINKYDITNVNYINSLFLETIILNEFKESTGFYKIDRANSNELSFNKTTRNISNLYDQSLSQNDAAKSNNAIKPKLCTKTNRVDNRYFIEFSGREIFNSDIDLTPSSGAPKMTNFFVVYRLKGYDASINWLRNCFSRQGDYFVGFSTLGDLIISNAASRFIRIGVANDVVAPYKNKANAGLLNRWCSLSIHWHDSSPRFNKSSVYCNRVKLTNFTSLGLQINNKMEIGALNFNSKHRFSTFDMNFAGTGMFKGDIALIVF